MDTLEFISQYLKSPLDDWRSRAADALLENSTNYDEVVEKLFKQTNSTDYDLVQNSLQVLFRISHQYPDKIFGYEKKLLEIATKFSHFQIAFLCFKTTENLHKAHFDVEDILNKLKDITTPRNLNADKEEVDTYGTYYCNDHILEYQLGSADNKYALSYVCKAFEYECGKASRKVLSIMKELGYKNNKKGHNAPARWRRNYSNPRVYDQHKYYYAYHSIQIFTMWCMQNLSIPKSYWQHFIKEQNDFEPLNTHCLITDRPDNIKHFDISTDTEKWFKKSISRKDFFESSNLDCEWVTLYENNTLRYEDKYFSKYVSTCFTDSSLSKIEKKERVFTPHYECRNSTIDNLEESLADDEKTSVYGNNLEEADKHLIASYGYISGDVDFRNYYFSALFPSLEVINFLKLKRRRGTLDFYKDNELVARCINWQNGQKTNVGYSDADKFEVAEHGSLLQIKSFYLKKFLKIKQLHLLTIGDITKRKINAHKESWDYGEENSRHRRYVFHISPKVI